MGVSIDNAFIEEYRDLVAHLAQQGDSRVRPHVTEVNSGGKAYNFERLAATDMLTKTGIRQATPYIDEDWSRRVATPETFNHNLTVEHEEKVQMIINPESNFAINQSMAVKRQYDDLCIAASIGDALNGDATTTALPSGQIIGTGIAPIDFDNVTEVQEIFMSHDITMDVPKVAIVGPTQVRKLLQLTQQTSGDYVQREALQTLSTYGVVPNWMGFTWIMSNRLLANVPGTDLKCVFMTKQAVGLAVNEELMMRIGEDPSNSYMIQVYCQLTAGAVRIEDEHVVMLHVADTI